MSSEIKTYVPFITFCQLFTYMFLIQSFPHCCSTVTVKNTDNAEVRVIYDAKEVISGLQAPVVKDLEVINIIYCLC